jgi:hypothetical protein
MTCLGLEINLPLGFFSHLKSGLFQPSPSFSDHSHTWDPLKLKRIYLIPTKIEWMQVNRASEREDVQWLFSTMARLCDAMHTKTQVGIDENGDAILEINLTDF